METLEKLEPQMLVAEYLEYKKQRVHGRNVATANWVTVLCHDCEAYAVYMRTVPVKDRLPMKESLGLVFSEGDDQARAIKRDLLDMGWDVEGAESQMAWGTYQITGRQDLKLRRPGIRRGVFAELKSCSPYTYDSINSVEDLKNHRWPFIVKWYRQVCLYMVLKSVDRYWLILKNKSTGQIKVIEFHLGDQELHTAEEMLKRAERVNHLVQIGQLPSSEQKISAPDLCPECEFFTACAPDVDFGRAAEFLSEEQAAEMEKKLERLAEIKAVAKEYESLDDDLKSEVKAMALASNADSVVIGEWIARLKRQEVKAEKEPRKAFTKTIVKFVKMESTKQAAAKVESLETA